MPLGVALLLAAVGGVLLAGIVASLRISATAPPFSTTQNQLVAAGSSDLALGSRLEHPWVDCFQQARGTHGCAALPASARHNDRPGVVANTKPATTARS